MDKRIKQIFEDFILKAHEELTEERRSHFLHGNCSEESYFEVPRYPSQLAYELLDLNTEAELERVFTALWKDDPRLLAMINPMLSYAFELRNKQAEQSDDLNSFIYTLY
jgi:hypothetical protein